MKDFRLIVSSVTQAKFAGRALSVRLPGVEGEFEILADHEPFIAVLKAGTVTITTADNEEKFIIKRGMVEVSQNSATVLI